MLPKKIFSFLIILAIIFKLFIYFYAIRYTPEVMHQSDSADYIESGSVLATKGVFAKPAGDGINFVKENFRTPRFPLFFWIFP